MKYIKKFETSKDKYEVGDIVKIKIKTNMPQTICDYLNSHVGEIIRINFNSDSSYPYILTFFEDIPGYRFTEFPIKENEFLRKATPLEIKEFNAKKIAKKYNL